MGARHGLAGDVDAGQDGLGQMRRSIREERSSGRRRGPPTVASSPRRPAPGAPGRGRRQESRRSRDCRRASRHGGSRGWRKPDAAATTPSRPESPFSALATAAWVSPAPSVTALSVTTTSVSAGMRSRGRRRRGGIAPPLRAHHPGSAPHDARAPSQRLDRTVETVGEDDMPLRACPTWQAPFVRFRPGVAFDCAPGALPL